MSLRIGKIKNHQLKYDMPLIVKHELILKMIQWGGEGFVPLGIKECGSKPGKKRKTVTEKCHLLTSNGNII